METHVTKTNAEINVEEINKCQIKQQGEVDTGVFLRVLKTNPKIEMLSFSKEGGDITISVKQEDVLAKKYINSDDYIIKTKFFANFVGELLVRQNIDKFINLLVKIDSEHYDKLVCGFYHKNFGMYIVPEDKTLRFQFHISLIQDILTENINCLVKFKT